VPLADGDVEFERWRRDDAPSPEQVESMREWLNRLPSEPRQDPSELVSREHPHSQDELRAAWLIDADAVVFYALDERDVPRNLYIGRHGPEGVDFWPFQLPF